MSQQLEQVFKGCDTRGSGFINQSEFRDLCRELDIDDSDADAIFYNLDRDGDGRISFQDFSEGFREFLTPDARRESLTHKKSLEKFSYGVTHQGSTEGSFGSSDQEARRKRMELKQIQAEEAWKSFADHLGQEDIKKVLRVSSDKIFSLYEDLQTSDAPTHLLDQYEQVISALVTDVKKMENETKKMEEKIAKERESHTAHLKNIEAELDAQVAKVESAVREKAKRDYEAEKRELQSRMDMEMTQLQSQLKIFQKIDTYLNKEKDESLSKEAQKKLDYAIQENRALKSKLSDTQTNIALLRAEMNQIRSQYDAKCSELNEERENKIEFVYEFDNLNRQLDLLRDANQQLQDTNDGLRTVVDVGVLSSPRIGARHEFQGLISPDILRSASDVELAEKLSKHQFRRKRQRAFNGSRTPSDNGNGSAYDSDSMRSKCSDRPKITEAHFGIRRFMDDLDSGHSTLPPDDRNSSTPDNLEDDAREVINTLEAAVNESYTERNLSPGEVAMTQSESKDIEQKERDISEVRKCLESSENLKVGVADNKPGIEVDDHVKSAVVAPIPAARKFSTPSDLARPTSKNPSRKASLSCRDLEPTGPPDRTYKVVFAGDAAVGKTSFINRITKGVFLSNLSSTLGVDFQVKTINVDERNIAIQLWDTAGQERFRSVTRSYFRRADGVMLLYDVTSDRSFLSVRQWIEAVDDVSEKRIPIMLCGNKIDLRAEAAGAGRRCVTPDEGERMARDHSAIFIETSAKDGKNVIDALVQLSRDMCSSEDVEVQTSALKIRDDGKRKKCC